MRTRGQERHEERTTRDKILDVAEELIDRHGMDGLRLNEVARRVGIRSPSIYAHFEGRAGIGDAVARRVLEQIAGLFVPIFEDRGDPRDALLRGVRTFAGHLHEHPSHVRMLLRDLARTRGSNALDLSSPLINDLVAGVGRLLEEGRRRGDLRAIDPAAFVAMVQGGVLARIGWSGFDDEGRPLLRLSRRRLQDEAEQLARALLDPGPADPA